MILLVLLRAHATGGRLEDVAIVVFGSLYYKQVTKRSRGYQDESMRDLKQR